MNILILGSGIVGANLANKLSEQGKNVFLIDDDEGVSRTETMISLEESINDKKRLMHRIFNELQ